MSPDPINRCRTISPLTGDLLAMALKQIVCRDMSLVFLRVKNVVSKVCKSGENLIAALPMTREEGRGLTRHEHSMGW